MFSQRRLGKICLWILQAFIACGFGFPLYWVVMTAFNNPHHVYQVPPAFLPKVDMMPFISVIEQAHWLHYISNTIFISLATVLLVIVTSALAGYALADMEFRFKSTVFLFVLATMMIPSQSILIPQYEILYKLHLLNTYAVQIIPFSASAFGIFIFRQFFKTIPKAYFEATQIEGGGRIFYLFNLALPLSLPAVITVSLLTFIGSWNMFQWPLIMTSSRKIQPLEVILGHYMSSYQANWPKMSSAILIALLPIGIVFFIAQRHIVAGVAGRDAGVKE